MTPHEITKVVRSAGFDPLAPPLREGTTYVLRATDFRGILMRVVVDARSGAIRAVNRIVLGPGFYGPIGIAPPPYGLPAIDGAKIWSGEESAAPRPTAAGHPPVLPPLPRPRPAALGRGAGERADSGANAAAMSAAKPDAKSNTAVAAPATAPAAPDKTPTAAPIND